MSKCVKYGHDLPDDCRMLCGHEDCPKHKLYKPTRFDTMNKCDTCLHKARCNQIDPDRIVLNGETHACLSYDKQPNRFDTFRQQTATLDSWMQWLIDKGIECNFCIYPHNRYCTKQQCLQGIKAYWEGVSE